MSRRRYTARTLALELLLVAGAVLFVTPLYLLVVLSLKPRQETAADPFGLPQVWMVSNYSEAWSAAGLGSAMLSSVIVTITSVVLIIVLGTLASFALARRQTRLSNGIYLLFLGGIIVPFQIAVIPLYQFMRDVNLLGSYWSLILYYVGLLLPLAVFLYTGFMRAQSRAYEEAALVDGATHIQALAHIVVPLMRPVTGTVMILCSIMIWNDFFTPLLFMSGTGRETLPVAIYSFVGQYTQQWGLVFAGLVIAITPILVLYFLLQRYIIQGFASGVKG